MITQTVITQMNFRGQTEIPLTFPKANEVCHNSELISWLSVTLSHFKRMILQL